MSWDRLHGHDAIREQFQTAFRRGRMAHAYLFVGPSGVGKKLFAIELGKALLCESPLAALTACDRCPSCVLVTANTHPDFTIARKPEDKLDFPVDTIRDLCGTLGLKPTRGTRKVAVVEGADEFTDAAANAFLKTLEEPPPGSTLILLTPSAESQLSTIRSRCQVVAFSPLCAESLHLILSEHGITDRAKADRLIRLAGGSAEQAFALNDDTVWDLRTAIIDSLGSPRIASAPLIEKWSQYIESAGKESSAQRLRACVVLRLLTDLLSRALHLAHGRHADDFDSLEAEKLQRYAARVGVDGLVDVLEKSIEADYLIDRRVQLVLLTELMVEKLSRAAA